MFDDKLYVSNIHNILQFESKKIGGKTHFPTYLNYYELIFKLNGENTTFFDDIEMHEIEGTVRFIPKHSMAKEYYVNVMESGSCIDIYFDTDYPMPQKAFLIDTNNNIVLKHLFQKIHKAWLYKKPGCYQSCMALFYDILRELSLLNINYLPSKKYQLIEPAKDYIEEHFRDNNFNYRILHTLCGLSYTYFKKLFIQAYGTNPISYVTNLKIQYACDLLKSNLYSVTEISVLCGYDSVYYFSRIFKKVVGIPPTKWNCQ